MSYDIFLYEPKPGESAEEAIERLWGDESDETLEVVPDEFRSKRKQQVAAAILKMNPTLEAFSLDASRCIELSPEGVGNGIQIGIYDDSATITFPYWHKGDQAEAVFQEVWSYLATIQKETGFNIFDPQLDAILNLADGYSSALRVYLEGAAVVDSVMKEEPEKKPWWKFW